MPRIGYWLGSAGIASGGSGPYAWRLLEHVLRHGDESATIVVCCCADAADRCEELVRKHSGRAEMHVIPEKASFRERLLSRADRLLARLRGFAAFDLQQRWLRSLRLDVLHSPYAWCPAVAVPWLFTLHDVQELHFPEFFTPRERAERAERNWKALEACAGVVVSYPHVKNDLCKFFGVRESKIAVCPVPFADVRLRSPSETEERRFRETYAELGDFLLYPAQTWPHKNHLGLLRAIEQVQATTGRRLSLVCTGHQNAKFFPALDAYLGNSPIAGQVRFTGIVAEEELHWLYRNCGLVVIPTLYEAGSFPLLEAMSLEVPVICSNVTSLPETMDDPRFVFDPRNLAELGGRILQGLDDAAFRAANIANSRRRRERLQTVETLPALKNAWDNAVRQGSLAPARVETLSRATATPVERGEITHAH